jgi:hypothetical protein
LDSIKFYSKSIASRFYILQLKGINQFGTKQNRISFKKIGLFWSVTFGSWGVKKLKMLSIVFQLKEWRKNMHCNW